MLKLQLFIEILLFWITVSSANKAIQYNQQVSQQSYKEKNNKELYHNNQQSQQKQQESHQVLSNNCVWLYDQVNYQGNKYEVCTYSEINGTYFVGFQSLGSISRNIQSLQVGQLVGAKFSETKYENNSNIVILFDQKQVSQLDRQEMAFINVYTLPKYSLLISNQCNQTIYFTNQAQNDQQFKVLTIPNNTVTSVFALQNPLFLNKIISFKVGPNTKLIFKTSQDDTITPTLYQQEHCSTLDVGKIQLEKI